MASYSAGLGGRKLKKVNTFKDMSRNSPSSPRPQRQQAACRAGAQRSPFYGNTPNIPAPEARTEEEAQGQAGTGGGGMNFGNLGSLGGIAGLGAGLSGIKTNFTENDLSNLEPIDTQKAYRDRFGLGNLGGDLSNIGAGFGGAAPASRAPIADTPVAGDPRVTEPDPSMFDQRQPQRSPWFGAGGDPTPAEEEEEAEIDWGDMGDADDPFGLGGLAEDLEGIGSAPAEEEEEGLRQEVADPDAAWREPEATESAREAAARVASGGIGGGTPPLSEGDDGDSDIDDWFDQQMEDHEAAWPAQEEKIKSQIARSMRRMADMQGGMGSSVAGGYAGAAAATVLGGIQVMSDALAAHQREGRNLQLAWMEKKSDRNFQREMAEGDRQSRLLEALFQSGEEISPEIIDIITGGQGLGGFGGEGGGGGEGVPEGATMDDEGRYVNADGDYLMGSDGLGSSGRIPLDPYAEGSESYQWYATTDDTDEPGGRFKNSHQDRLGGEHSQYSYYRIDENGEKVWWSSGYGTARYPGDKSFFNREYESRYTNDRRANVVNGNDPDRTKWGEPALKTERDGAMDYLGEMYGWPQHDDGRWGLEIGSGVPDADARRAIPFEIGYYISWVKTTTGSPPEWSEVEAHLVDVGYLDPSQIREDPEPNYEGQLSPSEAPSGRN